MSATFAALHSAKGVPPPGTLSPREAVTLTPGNSHFGTGVQGVATVCQSVGGSVPPAPTPERADQEERRASVRGRTRLQGGKGKGAPRTRLPRRPADQETSRVPQVPSRVTRWWMPRMRESCGIIWVAPHTFPQARAEWDVVGFKFSPF